MNLLKSALYDPAGAVSKATSSLLAMTAFDTTNLRLAVTVPAHGMVRFRIRCALTGATTLPMVMLGVMNGATIVGRVYPLQTPSGAAAAATAVWGLDAEFTATGLTPGAINFDAAYGVEVVVASTNIKYGGPNNTTTNDAWGAFVFEAWDPQPLKVGLDGGVNTTQVSGTAQTAKDIGAAVPAAVPGAAGGLFIAGTNAATTITAAAGLNALTLNGGAASGATPAGDGLTANGGAASITGGGIAGRGFHLTGGAGAASTNGAGDGLRADGGGTTTVAGANGFNLLGTGALAGLLATGGATGDGIRASGGATSGHGFNGTGGGAGAGMKLAAGTTGAGFDIASTAGDGIVISAGTDREGIKSTANGTGSGMRLIGGATGHGLIATGGVTGPSDGIKAVAGTGGVPIRGDLTGNVTGNLTGTVGNLASGAKTDVENAVWDTVLASHLSAGSTGAALNAAGAAGDPWITPLPGAYVAGTAGFIVGTNLDTTVSSRLATVGYTAPPTTAAIATEVWQDTTAGDFNTAGSIGKSLFTSGNVPGAASGLALVGSNMGVVTAVSGAVGSVIGNVGGNVSGAVNAVALPVTVGTNNDKTNYTLSAAGLDNIAITDPGPPASQNTFPKILVALWRRFFCKVVKDDTPGTIVQYADDGITPNSTQTFTVTATVDTLNKAT